jgi:hypothetical protein
VAHAVSYLTIIMASHQAQGLFAFTRELRFIPLQLLP